MEKLSFTDLALALIFTWLTAASFILYKVRGRWLKISEGKSLNLVQVLENISQRQELSEKNIARLVGEINQIRTLTKSSFQKSALIRFNPFEDTGGDQSFIVALLDSSNSGFVISSLHSRSGTRVYAKQVVNGLAGSHELSKEEKEVVNKAIKK